MDGIYWVEDEASLLAVRTLLAKQSLTFETDDAQTVVYEQDNEIIGTGSLDSNVLKCIAIKSEYQGEGILGKILTPLITRAISQGKQHLFIHTKPEKIRQFLPFGFFPVAVTNRVTLLENRKKGLKQYVTSLQGKRSGTVGAIIMNANPFTYGHRYLVETAAQQMEELQLFVLSSRKALIPPEIRLQLVKEGCADIPNVVIQETNDYLVSPATFPTYFLHGDTQKANAELDIEIFLSAFVPELCITDRYVGTEPSSQVTAEYNEQLIKKLPEHGVRVHVIDRKKINGQTISATTVRQHWKEGTLKEIKDFVPPSTMVYLTSKSGQQLIQTENV